MRDHSKKWKEAHVKGQFSPWEEDISIKCIIFLGPWSERELCYYGITIREDHSRMKGNNNAQRLGLEVQETRKAKRESYPIWKGREPTYN